MKKCCRNNSRWSRRNIVVEGKHIEEELDNENLPIITKLVAHLIN